MPKYYKGKKWNPDPKPGGADNSREDMQSFILSTF
jgi:hypothetical protein